jgi:O-antigen/teichoic acid export membrane protein
LVQGSRVFGLSDQALSSAQNFALLIIVARDSSPQSFGAFSVAIAAATLVVGMGQAVFGEASLILLGSGVTDARRLSGAVVLLTGVLGLGSSIIFLAISTAFEGGLLSFFLLLSLTIVPLLLHDVTRFLLIGRGNAAGALLADAAWTMAWLGWMVGASAHRPAAADHFLFWASTSSVGALVGLAILRPKVSLKAVPVETRKLSRLSRSLLFEWASLNGNTQIVVFALAAIVGLPATGGLRAAQSMFGPVNTLVNAIRIVFIREFAVLAARRDNSYSKRLATLISVNCALIACAVAVGGLLLPDELGTWLYGGTWLLAVPVLLPIAVQQIVNAATIGASSYLRGAGFVREAVKARTIGITTESVMAICIAPAGIMASAFGILAGTVVAGLLTWRSAARTFSTAKHSREQPAKQASN